MFILILNKTYFYNLYQYDQTQWNKKKLLNLIKIGIDYFLFDLDVYPIWVDFLINFLESFRNLF